MKPTAPESRRSKRHEKAASGSGSATAQSIGAGEEHANGHARGLNGENRPSSGYTHAKPTGLPAAAQADAADAAERDRIEVDRETIESPPGNEAPTDTPPDKPRANGRAPDGHDLIHVNGVTVDPRTIQGLVGYHLGKQYRGRPVVRDVSVGVQRGEVVGLLGPNGAGKTTCFYIITGLIRSDSGAIYLDGEEVTDLPMYRRARGGIGYLPQEASIFRGMSVEDNIMTVLEIAEPDRSKRKPMVDQLLEEFAVRICAAPRPWRSPAASVAG